MRRGIHSVFKTVVITDWYVTRLPPHTGPTDTVSSDTQAGATMVRAEVGTRGTILTFDLLILRQVHLADLPRVRVHVRARAAAQRDDRSGQRSVELVHFVDGCSRGCRCWVIQVTCEKNV